MLQTVDVDVNPEELVENVDVDAALATTAACGLSFCSSAVAEWAMDAAVSTADASMKIEGGGVYHSVLFIL